MKFFIFFSVLSLCVFSSYSNVRDTSQHLLSRQKRWLIWKEGINWVAMIFGIGIPLEVKQQSIVLGSVMKAYYLLPTNASEYLHPSIDYERRKKRSPTRWTIYEMIENYLQRNGGDGKACLLRSICEAASAPFEEKTGLLAEVAHAVFTPSETEDDVNHHTQNEYHAAESMGRQLYNCEILFPECKKSYMQMFTRLIS